MLNRESSKIISAMLFMAILVSCTDGLDKKVIYFEKKMTIMEEDSLAKQIHHLAADTVKSWINKDLRYVQAFKESSKNGAEWKIDEWVFIDSKKNRCLINVLVRTFFNSTQDDIYFILGEKYRGRWWFYAGPDLVVIQKNYNDDLSMNALPFNTLSEIAKRNALNWYFLKKETGVCIKELFSSGYSSYKECSEEEYLVNDQFFESELNVGMNPDPQKRIDWYLNVFLKSKYEE